MNASDPGRHDVPTLVVDDTLLYRILITEAVDLLPGFKVVGKAENGRVGMDLVRRLHPKLVLLDLEMPIMNGFEMLERLRREHPDVTVVIISALSKRGGHVTLDALHSGAFDFITKPEGEDASASRVELRSQLRLKLAPLRQDRRSAAPAAAAAATRSGSSHRARPGPASRLASRPQTRRLAGARVRQRPRCLRCRTEAASGSHRDRRLHRRAAGVVHGAQTTEARPAAYLYRPAHARPFSQRNGREAR